MTTKQLGAERGEVIGVEIIDTLRAKGCALVTITEGIDRIDQSGVWNLAATRLSTVIASVFLCSTLRPIEQAGFARLSADLCPHQAIGGRMFELRNRADDEHAGVPARSPSTCPSGRGRECRISGTGTIAVAPQKPGAAWRRLQACHGRYKEATARPTSRRDRPRALPLLEPLKELVIACRTCASDEKKSTSTSRSGGHEVLPNITARLSACAAHSSQPAPASMVPVRPKQRRLVLSRRRRGKA